MTRPRPSMNRVFGKPDPAPEIEMHSPGIVRHFNGDESPLTNLLKKARNSYRRARTGTNLHVSDVISRCVRKKALVERLGVPIPRQRLSLMDELTFAQGDAIHDTIKKRACQADPGGVYGKWHCECKALRVEEPTLLSSVDLTVLCENCGAPADVYDEIDLIDPELDMVGHPDLVLYNAALRAYIVTELKSISAKQYDDLVRPDPDHVIQVLFYWHLMRRAGYTLTDTVSILYVTKGYTFRGDPHKEFLINAPSEIHRLDVYLADARALQEARKGGDLPKRQADCANRASPKARECEVCSQCFDETAGAGRKVFSIRQAVR